MSLQVDSLPPGRRAWVEKKAIYLYSNHNEEWSRNQEQLQYLNEMGGRPVAHIAARNGGIRAKGGNPPHTHTDASGGGARQAYLRRGARCMMSSAVRHEWRLYNGEIGEVVDIIYRPGDRNPSHFRPAYLSLSLSTSGLSSSQGYLTFPRLLL